MANVVSKLHGANVYLNGKNYAGLASEVTLPDVTPMLHDHCPASGRGKIGLPYGMEEMVVTFKGDFDPSFVAASLNFYAIQQLLIYSTITGWEVNGVETQAAVMASLGVSFRGYKPSAFKAGEPSELEFTAGVWRYKLEVGGVALYNSDLLKNEQTVLGVDLNEVSNSLLQI